MIVYGQILCISLHASEGRKAKTSLVTVLICREILF